MYTHKLRFLIAATATENSIASVAPHGDLIESGCYPPGVMISSTRTRRAAPPAEKVLITRIIAGIGLALLLIAAAWSGAHHGSEASGTAVASAASATAATGVDALSPGDVATPSTIPIAAPSDAVDAAFLGVAACLLGAVFCLFVLAATRLLPARGALRVVAQQPRGPIPIRTTGRSSVPHLSLTELSLSRT